MIQVIDRRLKIPNRIIGYSGDNLVEIRTFELNRFYGDIDLSEFDFKLDTEINGTKNIIDLDKTVADDKITLTWTIRESHILHPGRMSIQIRAFSQGEEKWHSAQDYVLVQPSINATEAQPDPLPSEFAQMEARVTAVKNQAQEAAQTAEQQADRAQGIADTFENTTLPAAIQSVEQAVEEQIGIAKGHADRAQELADTFEQTTLPAAITAVEAAGQAKVDLAEQQAIIATTKAQEASDSAAAALASEQAAKASEDMAKAYAEDAEEFAGDAEEQAQIAANNILNGVDTHNKSDAAHTDIREDIRTVEALARGAMNSYVFDTYEDMMDWLQDPENVAKLKIGDNLYIRDVGVKDYWWDGTAPSELEAEAPDLTDYYTREQVDAMMPITITRADYDALVATGTVEAGRIYYIIEGDLA